MPIVSHGLICYVTRRPLVDDAEREQVRPPNSNLSTRTNEALRRVRSQRSDQDDNPSPHILSECDTAWRTASSPMEWVLDAPPWQPLGTNIAG